GERSNVIDLTCAGTPATLSVTTSLRIAPSTSPPASVTSTTPGPAATAPSEEAVGGAASMIVDSLVPRAGERVARGGPPLEAAPTRPGEGERGGERAVAAAAGGGELALSATAALVGAFATRGRGKRNRRATSLRHCAALNSGGGCGAPGAAEVAARPSTGAAV